MTTATKTQRSKPTPQERSRAGNSLSQPAKATAIQPKHATEKSKDKQGIESESILDQVASMPAVPMVIQSKSLSPEEEIVEDKSETEQERPFEESKKEKVQPEAANTQEAAASETVPSTDSSSQAINSNTQTTTNSTPNKPAEVTNTAEGDIEIKEEKEVEETESPIKRLALSAPGDEKVAKVEAMTFTGSSEESVVAYTEATASQIAASSGNLANAVNSKLKQEKGEAANAAPVLVAGTSGVEDPQHNPLKDPGSGKDATINDGVTEGEPAPTKLEPHKNPGDNTDIKAPKVDDKDKPKEEGGWLSWLFGKFGSALTGINASDSGVNTSAGKGPVIDTRGKADPKRAENMQNEGSQEVDKEKQKSAKEIQDNPGQQNIQPLYFEEEKPIELESEVATTAVSEQDNNMADFLSLPLPEDIRNEADKDMAPALEKSMAAEKAKTQKAVTTRDNDRKAEVEKAELEVQKLNDQAGKDQDNTIKENRKKIASEQDKGIKEVQEQFDSFNKDASKEKKAADGLIKDRVKKDNKEADKKLRDAENEAEKKRKEEEKKAQEEKAEAKRKSKKKSWWGRFKDAVSSAVKWVTDKISKAFKALKKWVGELIDKAKKAALALIEAGRKWIVDKLDKFGKWLKSKVNKYLKHFPALRKRINKFIDDTVDGAKKFVNKIADDLKKGVEALAGALTAALNKILDVFETVLTAAVGIIGAVITGDFVEALKIAFLATCKIAGIDPNPILNFIEKAGETIGKIFKDPIGFFKNVGSGVGQGINQFVTNIKKHLIGGLITWLTGAMSDVPIQLPTTWDLKGIFSLVMQILGLTYQQLRVKLVKELGPKGEQIVSGMEKTVDFVVDFVKRGPIALWEKIQNKFTEIKEMAMEKIRNAVIVEVVKAGVKWLLGLMNPASAIVKAVIMLYDLVMFFIQKKDQIIAFVTSVFDTVGPLARGEIGKAANFIEKALARSVPVILGLLASLAGIGGIGKSVSKAIDAIRGPVNKVIDPVIKWIAGIGNKMIAKGSMMIKKGKAYVKGKVEKGKEKISEIKGKLFEWWSMKKGFKAKDGNDHNIYFKGKGSTAKLMVHSEEENEVEKFLKTYSGAGNVINARTAYGKMMIQIAAMNGAYQAGNPTKQQELIAEIKPKIVQHRDELVTALGTMEIDGKIELGISHVQLGSSLGQIKFGIGAPITQIPGNTVGSPTGGAQILEEAAKERTRRGASRSFVQAHLISHQFHGPAESKNLVMAPATINKNELQKLEDQGKPHIKKGTPFYYGVQAEMHKDNGTGDHYFAKNLYKIPVTKVTKDNAKWEPSQNRWVMKEDLKSKFQPWISNIQVPQVVNDTEIKTIIVNLKKDLNTITDKNNMKVRIRSAVRELKVLRLSAATIATWFNSEKVPQPDNRIWTGKSALIERG